MRPLHLRAALLAALALLAPVLSPAVRADDEATAIARELTDAGAKLFAAKDARGLVDTYLDDAEVSLVQKDSEGLKSEIRRGRTAIEEAYRDLFKTDKPFRARNRVEHARFLGPDLLLITGTFDVTLGDDATLGIPFVQVRVRQGKLWLIRSVELFYQKTD